MNFNNSYQFPQESNEDKNLMIKYLKEIGKI